MLDMFTDLTGNFHANQHVILFMAKSSVDVHIFYEILVYTVHLKAINAIYYRVEFSLTYITLQSGTFKQTVA